MAHGLVLGGAALGLVSACSDSSSSNDDPSPAGSGGSGQSGSPGTAGKSGSPGTAGSGVAGSTTAGAGGATGGSAQGGFGGTPPTASEGGAAGDGGEPGQAGMPTGGAPVGGAGGASDDGGAAGAGERCDTAALAQPHAAACAVAPSVTQEYRVGLATEQQLSFGVRLRATGYFGLVHVDEIEVHYYFSQEESSGFQATVNSFVLQPDGLDLTASSEISIAELVPHQSSTSGPGCQTHFIRIRNSSPIELPVTGQVDTYAELHVTLTPNNAAAPHQNHANDHSYDPEATDWEHTGHLGVYHCGGLTSGCTPGDAGTCN